MGINKIKLFSNTIKYLKPIQIYYRLYYFVRNRFFKRSYNRELSIKEVSLVWNDVLLIPDTYFGNNSFSFLNIAKDFQKEIDWNYDGVGKLWTFNLNYFDFLNQKEIDVEDGLRLMKNYVAKYSLLKDGKASYPISLRGINWIKFLAKNKIKDDVVNQALYNQYQILSSNIEYHLLGNHLLENGFALLFGAYYFKDEIFYNHGVEILKAELQEQILNDGGHFELSPMYHQTMLFRVLDSIQLLKLNAWKNDDMLQFLERVALKMLSWLKEVTFDNGDIPMVNDSSYGVAPSTKELLSYGKHLDLNAGEIKLSDSGYRMFKEEKFELFVDLGQVGASYQPAHVHSDTFNFVLYANKQPILVDTGVSTYEKNELRQIERSTSSHNTIQIGNIEQTQVWGGFRVAKRAKIIHLNENKNNIEATHDGYANIGCTHKRNFSWNKESIKIIDNISKSTDKKTKAFFHFHSNIEEPKINNGSVFLEKENIKLEFEGYIGISLAKYELSEGFNKTKLAFKIIVTFDNYLKSKISL